MTTELRPVPKPEPRTEADRLTRRIASLKKLRASQKPIPRSPKPIQGGPRRKAVKKKRRTKKEDQRIYGPELFREYLHHHECLGCGYRGEPEEMQQAHVHTGGVGRKDDWERTGPLCGPRFAYVEVEGKIATQPIEGCHHDYDHAKKSWRTWKGRTFDVAQRLFFAEFERHVAGVRKLKGVDE